MRITLAFLLLLPMVALGQGPVYRVGTVAELAGVNPASIASRGKVEVVLVSYRTNGDFAPRIVSWVPGSTNAPDGGCVFDSSVADGTWEAGDCGSGEINVRWFGAYGTGTADDTAAVASARSAAASRGAVVYFPAGSYWLVGDGVTITGPRIEPGLMVPTVAGTFSVSNLTATSTISGPTVISTNLTVKLKADIETATIRTGEIATARSGSMLVTNGLTAGSVGTPAATVTNLTVYGAIGFGGETRTNWPTNGVVSVGGGVYVSNTNFIAIPNLTGGISNSPIYYIVYNGTNVSAHILPFSIDLDRIATNGAYVGSIPKFNGTQYVPSDDNEGSGGISLSGTKGDLIYHDGTNWTKLAKAPANGYVLASLNELPVWGNFDSGDINFITESTPFTNVTTAVRATLGLGVGNVGHTVLDTDLDAIMVWDGAAWVGFPIGTPWGPTRNETKLQMVCGALRQNTTNRAIWNFITNSTHRPLNFGGEFAIASSNTLTLSYGKTFSRVVAALAFADETFGGGANVIFGSRPSTTNVVISAGSSFAGSWVLRYTGAAWSLTSVSGSDVQPAVSSYVNGVLRLTHDYLRGGNIALSAWSNGGGNFGYLPVLKEITDSYVDIQWIDPTTGNIVTDATPLWRMTAGITLRHYGPLDLDGSNSADSLLGEDTSVGGNIWVWLLLED